MWIRRERPDDLGAARAVQIAAFSRPGEEGEPIEAPLLDRLRADPSWIPELSWVAEVDGQVVGHVASTRGIVTPADGGEPVEAVGLGPIGVLPDLHGSGIGSSLVHASIGAADALGEPLIALLGDPGYYRRFGFVDSADLGIEPPDPAWGAHFQVLPLDAWRPAITGRFAYAAPFDEL